MASIVLIYFIYLYSTFSISSSVVIGLDRLATLVQGLIEGNGRVAIEFGCGRGAISSGESRDDLSMDLR